MRIVAAAWIVALTAGSPLAGDVARTPDIEAIVPIPPTAPPMQWFGRRDHHVVPGTVTINDVPYRCDVDGKTFVDRERFVAHIRTAHGAPPPEIAARLVVRDGCVHFLRE